MSNVMLVPSERYNLFSMTKLMKDRWMLEDRINTGIMLKQEGKEVHFGEKVHTTKGVLFVVRIKRRATKGTRMGLVSVLTGPGSGEPQRKVAPAAQADRNKESGQGTMVKRTLYVNTAHQLLEHIGEHATRAISKHLR